MFKRVRFDDLLNLKIKFDKIEVDLHLEDASTLRKKVEQSLIKIPNFVKELKLIHGFNNGNVIKKIVKTEVRSKRIKKRMFDGMNAGATIYLLNEKKS